jgi:hypothetical protein
MRKKGEEKNRTMSGVSRFEGLLSQQEVFLPMPERETLATLKHDEKNRKRPALAPQLSYFAVHPRSLPLACCLGQLLTLNPEPHGPLLSGPEGPELDLCSIRAKSV